MKLAKVDDSVTRLVIVTKEEEETIEHDGVIVKATPAWKFLLALSR